MREHLYAIGQHVSYAEDGIAWPWRGGYEIIALLAVGAHEPKYQMRNADQSYDRVVQEHELTEDLAARDGANRPGSRRSDGRHPATRAPQ
jgi:hypothetical protein